MTTTPIEITYKETEPAKKEAAYTKPKEQEQKEEQPEYEEGFTKTFFYRFAVVAFLIICYLSYGKLYAYWKLQEAQKIAITSQQQAKKLSSSTGATIQAILEHIQANKKEWAKQDIVRINAENKQNFLNADTEKEKEKLEKFGLFAN